MADYSIVTGGSRGIGLAICRRLKQDGAIPIIFDREAPKESGLGEYRAVDLADTEATAAALEWALGLGPVTRLVNNVGVVMPALLEDTSLEDFDALMALNVRCAIQCTQALAPAMRQRGMGRIVNISSLAGIKIKGRMIGYATTKSALISFTRHCAEALAPYNIRVNCVAPGLIDTDMLNDDLPIEDMLKMIPAQRMGTPEEVAGAVNFLMSEEASYITRQVLAVNGGLC